MSITVICPIADAPAINAALDELGHGSGNLSIELRLKPGTGGPTHLGCHCWENSQFLADVESLIATFPTLEVITEAFETDADGNQVPIRGVLFGAIMKQRGFERIKKPGDTI